MQRGERIADGLRDAARRHRRRPPNDRLVVASVAKRRINARGENIGIHGPAAAQHKTCECSATEKTPRDGFPGRFIRLPCREANGTLTHTPCAQNGSTLFPLKCPWPVKLRFSISQRRGASLRRLFVKCGLNTGRCKACRNAVLPARMIRTRVGVAGS